jgi:hypothetical protein
MSSSTHRFGALMRIGLVVILAALAGCASSSGSGSQQGDQTIHVAGSGGGFLRVRGSDGARSATLTVPVKRAWLAMPAVFDSLGIQISEHDETNHVIGISGMKVHKQLGATPLSKYLDCGNTQGFPSADTYEVQLLVRTQLEAQTDGTTIVATMVEAVGRPMMVAGEYTRCTSKGILEDRIADALKRLGS